MSTTKLIFRPGSFVQQLTNHTNPRISVGFLSASSSMIMNDRAWIVSRVSDEVVADQPIHE